MNNSLSISAIALLLLFDDPNPNNDDQAQLLFKSGFENNVVIDSTIITYYEDYRYIRGTDLESGFSWPIDVLGASKSALHFIADDNQQAVNAQIQTVTDRNGLNTKALFQQQNYAHTPVTQAPYEILNITEGSSDLYVKYWMKLDASSLSQINKWRALFEYKTHDYENGNGFRLISFIYTDNLGNPFWHIQGDRDPQNPIWEVDNTQIPVPTDQWFLTEYYWKWSENSDGRVLWKINGQTIADHYGPTTRNAKPIEFIILSQIYGDANPKHQWVDDIEIWDALPQ